MEDPPWEWSDGLHPTTHLKFFPDWGWSDKEIEGSQFIAVPKGTKKLLHSKCMQSVPSEKRRIKAQNTRPRVPPLGCPGWKKEFAKVHTFILYAVPLLVSLLVTKTAGKTITMEEAKAATTAALELVCNANACISCPRHEKACAHLRKEVQPLAHMDELFVGAPPYLFGPEFVYMLRTNSQPSPFRSWPARFETGQPDSQLYGLLRSWLVGRLQNWLDQHKHVSSWPTYFSLCQLICWLFQQLISKSPGWSTLAGSTQTW